MTADQVRKRLDAVPFRPFEWCLADGRVLFVPHPDLLAFGSRSRTVTRWTEGSPVETIDLMLVLSLRHSEEDFMHETPPARPAADNQF